MRGPLLLLLLSLLVFRGAVPAASAATAEDILLPDEAFRFAAQAKRAEVLELTWQIADGYYLYRHKFNFVFQTPGIAAGEPVFPAGVAKQDRFFGAVDIYRHRLDVRLPVLRSDAKPHKLELEVTYQGCAEAGVCYLPIRKTVSLDLTDDGSAAGGGIMPAGSDRTDANGAKPFTETPAESPPDKPPLVVAEQDRIAAVFAGNSIGFIMLSFLGFGLLLAFTPCVFPMIPIISGIVVGQGPGLTTRKAIGLSLCYVLASALTYTLFGVLAGLFGSNLQAVFQQPWVIVGISAVFIVLALSTFGVFTLQVPASIQTKIAIVSAKQRRGSWLGAIVMGVLSALSIGPCVTAPLAGALIYIGKSGDALLGGSALFALGFGMGIPLLIVGTSAGKLMPRAGAWLHVTKSVFGTGLIAVAVWLLGRILPLTATLALWSLLLFIPLFYLGWQKLWKITGALALTYGVLLLTGIATHRQRDYLELLCNTAVACQAEPSLAFKRISTTRELRQSLAAAQRQGQWLMLEFYADWCVTCQELERETFSKPEVATALASVMKIQADVTQNSADAQALLQQFELIGPPAILFFGPDQQERKSYRLIGYINSADFLTHLRHILR